jgi:hypothetical protein
LKVVEVLGSVAARFRIGKIQCQVPAAQVQAACPVWQAMVILELHVTV